MAYVNARMQHVNWLLNIAYLAAMCVGAPWLLYQRFAKGKYRDGWRQKLFGDVPVRQGDEECIWFHAVSVGEVNALVPIVAEVRRRWPHVACLISTTTATGREVAQQRFGDLIVAYAPFDFSWAIRRVLRRWRPNMVVLAELELWPNWIRLARRRHIPVVVVNGRLSDHSFSGYRRWAWALRWMFRSLSAVAAQTDEYAERFRELGTEPLGVTTCGSVKFDGALTDRDNDATVKLREWAQIAPDEVVLLAGSTQAPEESMALDTLMALRHDFPQLRLVICPRHPQRFEEVAKLIEASGLPWARRSTDASGRQPIVLVDTMGELAHWWGCAHIAYVGGSMGSREGQNMIEPAAFGAAVSFGPRTRNFRDIVALLLRREAAQVVHDGSELQQFVRHCLEDPAWRESMGQRAYQAVQSQLGAVARTVDVLGAVADFPRQHQRAA